MPYPKVEDINWTSGKAATDQFVPPKWRSPFDQTWKQPGWRAGRNDARLLTGIPTTGARANFLALQANRMLLSNQPGMYSPFRGFSAGSSALTYGSPLQSGRKSEGLPGFGFREGRFEMGGGFVNYGLPGSRNPFEPDGMTPMERFAVYNQQSERYRQETMGSPFWPTTVNNREHPGYTENGTEVFQGLAFPTTGWANVSRWSKEILDAVAQVEAKLKVSVPPSVVAAIMMIESGGTLVGYNADGYGGLMQTGGPGSNIPFSFDKDRNISDPSYNIFLGTAEIAQWYLTLKNGGYGDIDWTDVAGAYFAGYGFNSTAPSTNDGNMDVQAYRANFEHNMAQLSGAVRIDPNGGIKAHTSMASIWGGLESAYISQEFGLTDYATGEGQGKYDHGDCGYAHDANCNYLGHVGLDIGIPRGTALYMPFDGVITILGGVDTYPDELSGGNRYHTGPLRIQLSNGDTFTLGHMSEIAADLYVGAHITAGMYVGRSGTDNGDHVHIEYFSPDDPRRYIDPREKLAGGTMAITGQNGQPTQTYNVAPGLPDARNRPPGMGTYTPFWLSNPPWAG